MCHNKKEMIDSYISSSCDTINKVAFHLQQLLKEFERFRLDIQSCSLHPDCQQKTSHESQQNLNLEQKFTPNITNLMKQVAQGVWIGEDAQQLLADTSDDQALRLHMNQAREQVMSELSRANNNAAARAPKIVNKQRKDNIMSQSQSSTSNLQDIDPSIIVIDKYSRCTPTEKNNIQRNLFNKARDKILLLENAKRKKAGVENEATLDEPEILDAVYTEATRLEQEWLKS